MALADVVPVEAEDSDGEFSVSYALAGLFVFAMTRYHVGRLRRQATRRKSDVAFATDSFDELWDGSSGK